MTTFKEDLKKMFLRAKDLGKIFTREATIETMFKEGISLNGVLYNGPSKAKGKFIKKLLDKMDNKYFPGTMDTFTSSAGKKINGCELGGDVVSDLATSGIITIENAMQCYDEENDEFGVLDICECTYTSSGGDSGIMYKAFNNTSIAGDCDDICQTV